MEYNVSKYSCQDYVHMRMYYIDWGERGEVSVKVLDLYTCISRKFYWEIPLMHTCN